MSSTVQIVRVAGADPDIEFDRVSAEPANRGCDTLLVLVDFSFTEYWTDAKNSIALTALFYRRRTGLKLGMFPTDAVNIDARVLESCDIDAWLAAQAFPVFDLNAPIALQPIAIPKPWGQEIWYTGIERRGVAAVGDVDRKIPLPWLLAAAGKRLGFDGAEPILLKILDPLPQPVFGDLYFELHQQKQEVYVVTAVDRRAWPDGKGAIRFGFDPALRRQYGDDQRFLADYFAAVRNYRRLRVEIDERLDAIRAREGVGLNEPVAAATLQAWLLEVPHPLRAEEEALRWSMERFTRMLPLAVGDVVKVPCLLPHSLQHGVRTVEFQTPVYERLIVSFAQKVLTQPGWDTDAAAALLQLDPPPPAPFPVTAEGEGWAEEQIVSFDNFEVRRIRLEAGARRDLTALPDYRLGIVVGGTLQLGETPYAPDAALLLPGDSQIALENPGAETAYFLVAAPLPVQS